jgi:predicted nucleic acid-binding protein
MSVYVVDASVAAKWFFLQEVNAGEAERLLGGRKELAAPDLLFIEMDSVICRHIRRGQMKTEEGRRIRDSIRQVPLSIHRSAGLLDRAYEIAVNFGQTPYDCLYLALAIALDGQMVTADRRLYDAIAKGPLAERILWVGDIPA